MILLAMGEDPDRVPEGPGVVDDDSAAEEEPATAEVLCDLKFGHGHFGQIIVLRCATVDHFHGDIIRSEASQRHVRVDGEGVADLRLLRDTQ